MNINQTIDRLTGLTGPERDAYLALWLWARGRMTFSELTEALASTGVEQSRLDEIAVEAESAARAGCYR